jgi:hypothetical protein
MKIIEKTFLAFDWIKKKIELPGEELRILEAHVNYFSAIHSYAAYRRKAALNFIRGAIRIHGLKKKYLLLVMKILIGHRILSRLR